MKDIVEEHVKKKDEIKKRLSEFKMVPRDKYLGELIFCILTPQSNAHKCWEAVLKLEEKSFSKLNLEETKSILKSRTRFHNNKSKYIMELSKNWEKVSAFLTKESDVIRLRNWLAENVSGIGMKESSHFLRNIGKSDNKIAILDRHILRNLVSYGVIDDTNIKNKNNYLDIEKKFINFSDKLKIPIDELDLVFWSRENGEIFK